MDPSELDEILDCDGVPSLKSSEPLPPRSHPDDCDISLSLPPGGILVLPDGTVTTLTDGASFKPACTQAAAPAIMSSSGLNVTTTSNDADDPPPQFGNFRDPFYASTFPQCYALAATTVVAYTLVIMLLITPRSFVDNGVVVLGRRGFTTGGTGGKNIGGRPWFQKFAALTVAISLTIASADTFRVAEQQYSYGVENAQTLEDEVLGSTELKVIRIISDTFLWLAQAQTLTRLFPRQREKVIIKWAAFALVTLGLIFDTLNSFVYTSPGDTRPRTFTDAVPALSYLFQLALGVLYAAWVIYYALTKKRYAFYHPKMRNICLVAVLSVFAILVPVVFFILDISNSNLASWGDYVRWVGAAAASVLVWEWVERIEALEREEKKDGILGREVFDGDEMLEITPSDFSWPRRRKNKRSSLEQDGHDQEGGDGGEDGGNPQAGPASPSARSHIWPNMSSLATRYRSKARSEDAVHTQGTNDPEQPKPKRRTIRSAQPPFWPARPAPIASPVSRSDTASAASTVYAVRFHPLTDSTSRTTDRPTPPPPHPLPRAPQSPSNAANPQGPPDGDVPRRSETAAHTPAPDPVSQAPTWSSLTLASPSQEPGRSTSRTEGLRTMKNHYITPDGPSRWDIRSRLEEFAVTQAERLRERIRPVPDTNTLPVRIIPAPARRGTALAQLLEEEELSNLSPSASIQSVTATAAVADPMSNNEGSPLRVSPRTSAPGAAPGPVLSRRSTSSNNNGSTKLPSPRPIQGSNHGGSYYHMRDELPQWPAAGLAVRDPDQGASESRTSPRGHDKRPVDDATHRGGVH